MTLNTKVLLKQSLILIVIFLSGCIGLEEFFTDPEVKKGVDGGAGVASSFGPWGTAGGLLLTSLYAVGRSYFTNREHIGEKATISHELDMAKKAFSGVVNGVQKAKTHLPPEQVEMLHKKLEKHIPDWIHPLIDDAKGDPQGFSGRT